MTAAYHKAAFPEPYQILGLKLKPLSLGRYRLLQRFNCAFVSEEETTAALDDLLIGILICSMTCRDFAEFMDQDNAEEEIKKWGERCGLFDFEEKAKLFNAYITEASKVPEYTEEDTIGHGSGSHWSQSVEVALRSELGWSKEEIDEEPLGKALADYFKLAENKGTIRLLTDEEIEAAKANAAILWPA